jgi:hypothetical protein
MKRLSGFRLADGAGGESPDLSLASDGALVRSRWGRMEGGGISAAGCVVAATDPSLTVSRGTGTGPKERSLAGVAVLEVVDGALDVARVIRVNSALSPPES